MLSKGEGNYLLEPQGLKIDTGKIKILVVEDDHTTRLLYDKGLFNQIFDKKMVASGKEAILVYDKWHPDIIVLDIFLPEMTGYQVLKTIRTDIEDKKTTIVMATALSSSQDVQSCIKLGIEGYIIKPFQCGEIGVKILSYYAKREPERAQKAQTLCKEISKQSQVQWLLDIEKPKTKEGMDNSAAGRETREEEQKKKRAKNRQKN